MTVFSLKIKIPTVFFSQSKVVVYLVVRKDIFTDNIKDGKSKVASNINRLKRMRRENSFWGYHCYSIVYIPLHLHMKYWGTAIYWLVWFNLWHQLATVMKICKLTRQIWDIQEVIVNYTQYGKLSFKLNNPESIGTKPTYARIPSTHTYIRYFKVNTTSSQRYKRCIDVETTLCAYRPG